MDTEQVADALGVTQKTVRRWANKGLLPVVRIGRGFLRFRRDMIMEILRGQTNLGKDKSCES